MVLIIHAENGENIEPLVPQAQHCTAPGCGRILAEIAATLTAILLIAILVCMIFAASYFWNGGPGRELTSVECIVLGWMFCMNAVLAIYALKKFIIAWASRESPSVSPSRE